MSTPKEATKTREHTAGGGQTTGGTLASGDVPREFDEAAVRDMGGDKNVFASKACEACRALGSFMVLVVLGIVGVTYYATVVVVFSNGVVENEVIELPDDCTDETIARAAAALASCVIGRTLSSVTEVDASGEASVDELCRRALAAIREVTADDHVYVGGTSAVAESFDAVDVVRNVLHTLEQQFVVVTLVRNILDRGMSVAIGIEHGVEPLAACSVVVAPVVVDGEHLGSVGVLGPTRMNYPQALATVEIVSERLGERLGES